MSDNLALWRSVEKTDPKQVKAITGKPYTGTSPKPYFIVQQATKAFGPIGIGWGFDIVEEKLLDGALLEPGFYERIHVAKVRVWYLHDGKRGEIEHVGQTAFCGRRKDGKPYTDEDAPKKSVTDALIKALSLIGFAGDIFMGRFDDSKYVNELKQEFAQEAAQKPTDAEPSMLARYVEQAHRIIASCKSVDPLKKWWAADAKVREDMGIVSGTPEYAEIHNAFITHGKALAAQSGTAKEAA